MVFHSGIFHVKTNQRSNQTTCRIHAHANIIQNKVIFIYVPEDNEDGEADNNEEGLADM